MLLFLLWHYPCSLRSLGPQWSRWIPRPAQLLIGLFPLSQDERITFSSPCISELGDWNASLIMKSWASLSIGISAGDLSAVDKSDTGLWANPFSKFLPISPEGINCHHIGWVWSLARSFFQINSALLCDFLALPIPWQPCFPGLCQLSYSAILKILGRTGSEERGTTCWSYTLAPLAAVLPIWLQETPSFLSSI